MPVHREGKKRPAIIYRQPGNYHMIITVGQFWVLKIQTDDQSVKGSICHYHPSESQHGSLMYTFSSAVADSLLLYICC